MQSEDFDSKAKDAAERHHPPYDEKAWTKMEKLLDKHLPQEKNDKRRIAVVLLLLLFLGAGSILLLTRPWDKGKLSQNENIINAQSKGTGTDPEKKGSPASDSKPVLQPATEQEDATGTKTTADPVYKISDLSFVEKKKRIRNFTPPLIFPAGNVRNKTTTDPNDQNNVLLNKTVDGSSSVIPTESNNQDQSKTIPGMPVSSGNDPAIVSNSSEPPAEPKSETPESAMPLSNDPTDKKAKDAVAKKPKAPQKPQSRFFLSLSAGPDVSTVGLGNFGRMLITYGAGVGYRIGDKFTLRTGVYSSRKLYTASPYDYHPPDQFWQYYTSLRRVNADCRVIEIPLSMSYNIHSNERRTWFGSIGMSSYIMKRESYDYIYKNSWGTMSSWKTTIRNKNEHYFSVLGLSGGYHKRINNTLSFMAEPYVRIPLTGVGYGKVKLASAGVLFSLGIHAPTKKKGTPRKP